MWSSIVLMACARILAERGGDAVASAWRAVDLERQAKGRRDRGKGHDPPHQLRC